MTKKIENETEEEKKSREIVEQIAASISALARATAVLLGGKVSKKAIVILLAHSSKLSKWQVEKVLDSLQDLEKEFLK